MTKEEAVEYIRWCMCEGRLVGNTIPIIDEKWQALDMAIKALGQQPKTGCWILADEQSKDDIENDNYRFICSECQCSDIHAKGTIVPYCWKCGSRMVKPQESEDRE